MHRQLFVREGVDVEAASEPLADPGHDSESASHYIQSVIF